MFLELATSALLYQATEVVCGRVFAQIWFADRVLLI